MITYESLPPSHSKHGQPLLILPRQLLYAVTMTITTVDWEIFTLKIINFRIKKYFIARWFYNVARMCFRVFNFRRSREPTKIF